MNSTRESLALDAARMYDATQEECRAVVEQFFSVLAGRLAMGHTVQIRGFGTLFPRIRPQRPGRNVRAGTKVVIPEHKTVMMKFPKGYLRARS